MLPSVKWWRAKASCLAAGWCADWFEQTKVYPGFVLPRWLHGNVRVFRDMHALNANDGALSIDLPLKFLDEVQPPVQVVNLSS